MSDTLDDPAADHGAAHAALGDFLRVRRERLNAEALGVPSQRRRRTPGLRREQVAERAGIGVDWYIRLEQGRAVSASSGTIDALARALCLAPAEHAHLRALARVPAQRPFAREAVPDTIRQIVHGLPEPAYVTGQRWDVLCWNRATTAAIVDFARIAAEDRNILLFMFTNPDARLLFRSGWADSARRMVAQFRTTHDLWSGDPAFRALVDRLIGESRDFARWWRAHDIGRPQSGMKLLYGKDGVHRYMHASFQANDDPALRLVIYSRTPTPGRDACI